MKKIVSKNIMTTNKFQKLDWASKIYRVRGPRNSRFRKIRLDKNEKPNDHEVKFFKSIKKKLKHEHLTAYPETEKLYDLIAKKFSLKRKSLVLTPGSDAGIKSCLDLCVEKSDHIITIDPTFAMVDMSRKIKRVKQIKIKYDQNLKLDIKKILKIIRNKKISLVIIANPNSPTGTIVPQKTLLNLVKVCEKKNIVVLVDEAYYGFYKGTLITKINRFKNLIISRTFSKAFGLAGCRVGFLATNNNLAQKLYNLRPMYEINSIGVLAAQEILKNLKVVKKYVNEQIQAKNYFLSKLKKRKIKYLDSYANFIYVDFKNKKKFAEKYFLSKNILIKGSLGIKRYENFLRISLGPKLMMNKVLKIILKINK